MSPFLAVSVSGRDQQIADVIAEAKRYLGAAEAPRGSNRGVEIDYWVKSCGLDPAGSYPWCACFVYAIGRQALGTRLWPLPNLASVQALHDWAKGKLLVREDATPGDVFLLWERGLKPPRFGHTGFVVEVTPDGSCRCVEGNTNPGGSREGFGVFASVRRFGAADRFIRWHAGGA